MPGVIEQNIHAIWAEKQSAKGTPATTGTKRFRYVAGATLDVNPDMGQQAFNDGTAYGDAVDWLNSIVGQGQPSFEGGTDELAWLLWAFHGAETVSPSGTNAVQTLTTTGTPTGGTVPLSFDGRATTVAFNAAAAAVQAALEALPNIGTGNVVCAGGALPTGVTITFQGSLAKRPVPLIVTGSTGLTGGASPTGVITNTTPGVNATHTFAPTNSLGFWSTWWETVGSQNKQQLKYNDVRIGGVQIQASTGNKDLQVSPQLLSLDPGEIYTSDPVLVMPTDLSSPVMLFTEAAATWTVDGVVIRGTTQFQVQLAYNIGPVYGDDVTAYDLERGTAIGTITLTTKADDVMLARWYNWLYGTPTPTAGTKPIKRIPPLGSFSTALTKKDSAGNTIGSFAFTAAGVRWQLPNSVAPNLGQGSGEISLTGSLRKLGSNALYAMSVGNQVAAYTA
jgi:hypothetical protein